MTSGWISSNDKKPDSYRLVLMCWDGWEGGKNYRIHDVDDEELEIKAPYVGFYDGKNWHAVLTHSLSDACYWMYMPEAPPNGKVQSI